MVVPVSDDIQVLSWHMAHDITTILHPYSVHEILSISGDIYPDKQMNFTSTYMRYLVSQSLMGIVSPCHLILVHILSVKSQIPYHHLHEKTNISIHYRCNVTLSLDLSLSVRYQVSQSIMGMV